MARMIPDSFQYSKTKSGGEERVYNSLRDNLDNNWLVCHSWRWIRHFNNKQRKSQGEGDFVIFNPEYGIIVVEVKGGTIEYKNDGKYYSNGILIQNPEKQSSDTKFDIIERLKEHKLNKDFFVIHCVWFPDIEWNIEYPPNLNSRILLDHNAIESPEKFFKEMFNGVFPRKLSNDKSEQVEKLLLNTPFILIKRLKFRILDMVDELVRLTKRQEEAFELLNSQKSIGVKGRAGTGKTILAVSRAMQLANNGEKVLFICYNRSLADFLSSQISLKNIDVYTYHSYAIYYLNKYHPLRLFVDADDKGFFDFVGNELSEVIEYNNDEYAACIIDEAQDLNIDWFTSLKKTFYPQLKFYFFFDPLQIIYTRKIEKEESQFNFGAPLIPLDKNLRNSNQVSKSSLNILKIPYDPIKHFSSLDGDYPEVILCEKDDLFQVEKQIKLLTIAEHIQIADITILSMKGEGYSSIGQNILGIDVIPFRKFKGLENKVILIVDVNYSHFIDEVYCREFYMALTRSIYKVVVFIDNTESLMKKSFMEQLNVSEINSEIILTYFMENHYE